MLKKNLTAVRLMSILSLSNRLFLLICLVTYYMLHKGHINKILHSLRTQSTLVAKRSKIYSKILIFLDTTIKVLDKWIFNLLVNIWISFCTWFIKYTIKFFTYFFTLDFIYYTLVFLCNDFNIRETFTCANVFQNTKTKMISQDGISQVTIFYFVLLLEIIKSI